MEEQEVKQNNETKEKTSEDKDLDQMEVEDLDKMLDKALDEESETTEEVEEITEEKQSEEVEEEQEQSEESSGEELDKRFEGKPKEEVIRSYKELEKKLGQQGAELGELRKQLQELQQLKEQKELGTTQETVETQEEEKFDPEKWQELLAEEPLAAAQYYMEKYVLPEQRRIEQKRMEAQRQAEMAKKQQELLEKQATAFEQFANEVTKRMGLTEEELNAYANFLANYSKPDPKKGYYDVEDLKKRYFWYKPEKLQAEAAKKMLETVEEQAPKVQTLGGVQNAKTKSPDPFKDVHDLVEAEKLAENYSPEELEQLLDQMEE